MKENIIERKIIQTKPLARLLAIIVFTALTIALPLIAHHYQLAGTIFLPMHFFVLAAGLLFGWQTGLAVGAISPIISLSLSGMPPMTLIPIMTVEISAYGFFAGLLKERGVNNFSSLILAMILGRIVLLFGAWLFLSVNPFIYFYEALKLGIVGVALQLSFLPFLVTLIKKYI